MLWKSFVKNKDTGKWEIRQSEYSGSYSKAKNDFIDDLKKNGYMANYLKTQPAVVFDYVQDHTQGYKWDWEDAEKIFKKTGKAEENMIRDILEGKDVTDILLEKESEYYRAGQRARPNGLTKNANPYKRGAPEEWKDE